MQLRLRMFHKILLGLALTVLPVVVIAGLFMSWSIEEGFVQYLKQSEAAQLALIQERLAQEYTVRGDWDFVDKEAGARMWMSLSTSDRAALYDANQTRLLGSGEFNDEALRIPVIVHGEAVGWMLVWSRGEAAQANVQYLRRQYVALVSIVVAALVLVTLASVLLTRDMLSRVQALVMVTRKLTGGDFEVRMVNTPSTDELAQLGRHVNTLAHTLAENKQARERHIADISHELRTPLAVLRGEIEAAQDGIRPLNVKTLGSLHDEAMRLTRLVEDLYQLSLADIGQLQYTVEPLKLLPVVEDVAELFTARLAQHHLELVLDWEAAHDVCIEGDRDKLKQLLTNLFENSCRYTDPGGSLKVSAEMADPTTLSITMDDTAPAVPTHALPHLFKRLFRAEQARTRATGGSGLGLAICERIVQAHNGRIIAAASPMGGLRVEILLPVIDPGGT